jgi:hypothetical protein
MDSLKVTSFGAFAAIDSLVDYPVRYEVLE